MVELLDSKEIHSIESRMIALLDRTFLKSTKLDSVDYKKELPKNVKRWFGSKTFEIQLNNLITELIKFSLLYADSQMKILTAAKVEEGTILTKEAIARATDISENAAKSIIKMLEDDAIYYEGPAKLGRRIEDLWQGQRSKAVSFAHTFSADVATATTVYRYRQYGVQFMEFSAKIDERTTDQCRCLHHVVFDLSKQSVDAYRPPLHHNCICAGSLIKTLQGDVPIEHIRVGDLVFTTEGRYMPVTCTMSNIPDRIIEISTKNRTIKITPNHPILHFNTKSFGFVEWLEAGELGIGDVIVTLDGYERIQSILEAPIEQVYNISVQEDEDYVANGIYVHNCRSALLPIPNTREPQNNMIFENRDFSGTLDDPNAVKKVFDDIDKFNSKYRVSGYVIDKDLSTRIMMEKGAYVSLDLPKALEKKVKKELGMYLPSQLVIEDVVKEILDDDV